MDLKGLWSRSLIAWPDGRRDSATRVHWLQGIGLFVDLRQPDVLPGFAQVAGLNQLSRSDCEQLATQEGFAGRLGFDGRHYEWVRRIDFQPKSPIADAGSLAFRGEMLIERGRDVDYVEHWHRDSATASPCGAALLRDGATGADAVLVRVGAAFMFARGRVVTLPPYRTLRECVAAAPNVAAARSFLDCEISAGVVEAAGFRITASTLPFRRGCLLGQQVVHNTVTTRDLDPDGHPTLRVWDIADSEGDPAAL